MKHALLIAGTAVLLASGALAEKGKDAKAQPKELPCAVMKEHKVNIKKATADKAFADHKGKRYFFCCAGCVPEFKKNPEKYASNPSIPAPKK